LKGGSHTSSSYRKSDIMKIGVTSNSNPSGD
jgi:hypothetical protein